MSTATITVITPTMGRPSLLDALLSMKDAGLRAGDQAIVVTDGHIPCAADIVGCAEMGDLVRLVEGPATHDFGNAQRNAGLDLAQGDLIMFLDDDNRYMPGIFDDVRSNALLFPDSMLMYRLQHQHAGLIWRERKASCCNVDTAMCVVPRRLLGDMRWNRGYTADHNFISRCVDAMPSQWLERQIIHPMISHGGRM